MTGTFNQAPPVDQWFRDPENTLFLADRATVLPAGPAAGKLRWQRHVIKPQISFNRSLGKMVSDEDPEFPAGGANHPELPFKIDFVTARTIRLRLWADDLPEKQNPSPMLEKKVPSSRAWQRTGGTGTVSYRSSWAGVKVVADPWSFSLTDAMGNEVLKTFCRHNRVTMHPTAALSFSFVRRLTDMSRHVTAAFSLAYDEMIFGGGESFTRLNKRGQRLELWTNDTHSVQTTEMYKPVPFFLSNKGYGIFIHTGTPVMADIGKSYDAVMSFSIGGPVCDLFFFIGSPKEVLSEYTRLTGRSPLPPDWSFGLWMSRISYRSATEVASVAGKLRKHRISCDVIHIDTDWFKKDWQCDWEWDRKRFPDPAAFVKNMKRLGFHLSLWQLPYISRENRLFNEAWEKGYLVKTADGILPSHHACIDFTNPEAVAWYQAKLHKLLKQGIGAIKVDFGEGAPETGRYANGRSGFYEHNLYPLRYNKAAADVTKKVKGYTLIWARSAWAGSQRYPVHWGGDAESSFDGMAATLRGGLSLGLCGFSFWSHDIGGFSPKTPLEVYRKWLPFGMLTSHSRCHGVPPTEPWEYGTAFVEEFRKAAALKYSLMPYILKQAEECSRKGHPFVRPLFFEYPDDPDSWLIEDEYLFGTDFLVAPVFSETDERRVYLPPGTWKDFWSGKAYQGSGWHRLKCGEITVILLRRDVRSGNPV